jgi:hypothetical protein
MRSVNVNWFLFITLGVSSVYAADVPSMTFKRLTLCSDGHNAPSTEALCLQEPLPTGGASYVLAVGQIERQTAEALATMSADLPKGTTIILQSPGGDLLGGLMLGQYIRAREFNTYVADESTFGLGGFKEQNGYKKCISACAYSFLGGTQRLVASRADFGVHQFRGKDNTLDPIQTQKIAATLGKYMDAMDVSRNLLDQALMTDPGKVTLIAEHQRKSWRVETNANRVAAPLSLWQLETSTGGKKLAFQSKRQVSSNAIVTAALARFDGQMKLLLVVKPDASQEGQTSWLAFFKQRTDLRMRVNSQVFTLRPDSDWVRAGKVNTEGTRQIWYVLSSDVLANLESTHSFVLQPLWQTLPNGLDNDTYFLTSGLSQLLPSL